MTFSDAFFLGALRVKPLYSDGFPININTISMGLPIVYFKGSHVELLIYDLFLSLKVVIILGLNEMYVWFLLAYLP